MSELISVIVPVYNVEKYLDRCIESIAEQTYQNLEIILVDDGSPDNSGKICDEWAENDDRIIVIHKENGGVSSARNRGLDIAKGEYIMFCDSDDWVEPNWCECLYNGIHQAGIELAVCGFSKATMDGTIVSQNSPTKSIINLCDFPVLIGNYLNGPVNKIYISKNIRLNQIKFPEGLSLGEDARFVLDYLKYCNSNSKISLQDTASYCYRNNTNSLTHHFYSDFWDKELELIKLTESLARFLKSDFDKYDSKFKSCDFYLITRAISNNFSKQNPASIVEKYNEFKRIVLSQELNAAISSKQFQSFPCWYSFLLRKKFYPVLFLYHLVKS